MSAPERLGGAIEPVERRRAVAAGDQTPHLAADLLTARVGGRARTEGLERQTQGVGAGLGERVLERQRAGRERVVAVATVPERQIEAAVEQPSDDRHGVLRAQSPSGDTQAALGYICCADRHVTSSSS